MLRPFIAFLSVRVQTDHRKMVGVSSVAEKFMAGCASPSLAAPSPKNTTEASPVLRSEKPTPAAVQRKGKKGKGKKKKMEFWNV